MKRILITAVVAALAVPAVGLAGATHPTVKLEKTSKGKLLANSAGLTIFVFSKDTRNQDNCVKRSSCPGFWPPLTTKGKPTGATGIKASLLGTITLAHGKKQVTYNGHPLYTFAGDSPGDISYIGQQAQGGTWWAINAAGKIVK